MISPDVMFWLSLVLMGLGQTGVIWMIRDLRLEVVRLALTTDDDPKTVDPTEFDELRKLVFSQSHIIRALHDDIAELQKRGGCKTATTKVSPKSNDPRRRKVSKNNVFQ